MSRGPKALDWIGGSIYVVVCFFSVVRCIGNNRV